MALLENEIERGLVLPVDGLRNIHKFVVFHDVSPQHASVVFQSDSNGVAQTLCVLLGKTLDN